MTIDAVPTPSEIDRALARLEMAARERGIAVGISSRAAGLDRAHRQMGEDGRPRLQLVPITRGGTQAEADLSTTDDG